MSGNEQCRVGKSNRIYLRWLLWPTSSRSPRRRFSPMILRSWSEYRAVLRDLFIQARSKCLVSTLPTLSISRLFSSFFHDRSFFSLLSFLARYLWEEFQHLFLHRLAGDVRWSRSSKDSFSIGYFSNFQAGHGAKKKRKFGPQEGRPRNICYTRRVQRILHNPGSFGWPIFLLSHEHRFYCPPVPSSTHCCSILCVPRDSVKNDNAFYQNIVLPLNPARDIDYSTLRLC